MADMTTRRSQTGIIHLLNKTTIEWHTKTQSCIVTAAYGRKYSAYFICIDHIVDLFNNLCYLGVPLHMVKVLDAPFMFGDNFSVVNLTIMSSGKLQRRSHILNYHLTREAQADVIIKFVHMNGKEIPAGIVTKRCTPNT